MEESNHTSLYCLEHFEKCLCSRIVPVFHEELDKIYQAAAHNRVLLPDSIVIDNVQVAQYRNPILPRDFQDALCSIPVMNQTMIDKLYSKVCAGEEPYVNKLIQAIFAYSTQLACISSNVIPSSIDLSIPDGPHFIHSAFVTAGRKLWSNPLLLCVEGMTSYQRFKQNNKFQILLMQCVLDQVRVMLPTANILNNLQYGMNAMDEDQIRDATVDLRRQDLNHMIPSPIMTNNQFEPMGSSSQPVIYQPQSENHQELHLQSLPSSLPLTTPLTTPLTSQLTSPPVTTTTTVTTAGGGGPFTNNDQTTVQVSSSDEEEDEETHKGHDNGKESGDDQDKESSSDSETEQEESKEKIPQADVIVTQPLIPTPFPTRNPSIGSGHNVIRIDTGV